MEFDEERSRPLAAAKGTKCGSFLSPKETSHTVEAEGLSHQTGHELCLACERERRRAMGIIPRSVTSIKIDEALNRWEACFLFGIEDQQSWRTPHRRKSSITCRCQSD